MSRMFSFLMNASSQGNGIKKKADRKGREEERRTAIWQAHSV